jgi:hypothetical protein
MVKVVIELPAVNEHWPPVGSERLWAIKCGTDLVELNNIPFYARGYSAGDVVRISENDLGELIVGEVVEPSDNCTIRVIPLGDGDKHDMRVAVMNEFTALGVESEADSHFNVVALHVPPSADVEAMTASLLHGSKTGRWQFDGGVLTEEMKAALSGD